MALPGTAHRTSARKGAYATFAAFGDLLRATTSMLPSNFSHCNATGAQNCTLTPLQMGASPSSLLKSCRHAGHTRRRSVRVHYTARFAVKPCKALWTEWPCDPLNALCSKSHALERFEPIRFQLPDASA